MEPFKNWLNEKAAQKIALSFERAMPRFDSNVFLKNISKELAPLELKERMSLLCDRLQICLPINSKKSFPILIDTLKKDETDNIGLTGFLVWPLTEFVARNGLGHFDLSMNALYHMTQVFTGEFAIRQFFLKHEEKTLKVFKKWTQDSNVHVRRLVSEGSRPLLPWGLKLESFVKNPEKTWNLLEELKLDNSNYVQKSVANHINDHSKNHPDWLVKKLNTWKYKSSDQNSIDWIIRHGTRTLIKKGHVGALKLQGVSTQGLKVLAQKILTPKIKLGSKFKAQIKIKNLTHKKIKIIIDQDFLLLKSNKKYSSKIFKGKIVNLNPMESQTIELNTTLKTVTTRKYYSGDQHWTAIVNGQKQKPLKFNLKT